jgi:deoxyribose-phosphate aldolase
MNLAKYIDHTILKPDATKEDIRILCEEAKTYGFASVCVNPYWVSYAKQLLQDTDVAICTVVGFPLGATPACVKAYETNQAIEDGADEIDMVINIGALKSQDTQTVLEDIKAVVKASKQKLVKVIIETCLLTDEQKRLACRLALEAQADFVKTSTGFSSHGATLEDVALMKSVVKDQAKVKASGGIRDYATAMSMIEAGASRLGTSSGVKITKNL